MNITFSPGVFPFLLNLILLDVLSVIHHGLMLAGGDPENHGVSGNRNDTLWRITVLLFSTLKRHKFDYMFMENRIVYVDLCV